jgi:hypothetical protein
VRCSLAEQNPERDNSACNSARVRWHPALIVIIQKFHSGVAKGRSRSIVPQHLMNEYQNRSSNSSVQQLQKTLPSYSARIAG